MNASSFHRIKKPIGAVAIVILSACSTVLPEPEGAGNARDKLSQLQSDSQLASRAPVEIKGAELAVRAAEQPRKDVEQANHLVLIADRKVDIAAARAQSRLLVDQRKALSGQRETARLDSRTREADSARGDATSARADAQQARMGTESAQQRSDDLQRQIVELKARATDRGLIITLGDLLFASGKADIKKGAAGNLDKLVTFLNQYPGRTVLIEGHTDSLGSDDANVGLSQRRADSVKAYLVSKDIDSDRLTASGKGESYPVVGNDSADGRQQNRRVEVIISNELTSPR